VNDVIEIRDLRVSAIVGVLVEERDRAQPIAIDLDLWRDFETAALNDDLTATSNYATVITLASRVAVEGRFLLLEALAYRVAHEVLALDLEIERVSVAVRKLRPPVSEDVATVGVRCTLDRAR
jgi:dihydroneopterin aldolase